LGAKDVLKEAANAGLPTGTSEYTLTTRPYASAGYRAIVERRLVASFVMK
jgi:hypothetical protein